MATKKVYLHDIVDEFGGNQFAMAREILRLRAAILDEQIARALSAKAAARRGEFG